LEEAPMGTLRKSNCACSQLQLQPAMAVPYLWKDEVGGGGGENKGEKKALRAFHCYSAFSSSFFLCVCVCSFRDGASLTQF